MTLSQATSQPVTVAYATADGTALAGSDYVAASGTLTFAPGETRKTVTVTIIGDSTVESSETLFLRLSNPTGAALGTNQALGTIVDDDKPVTPALVINDVSVTEGNTGTTAANFVVSLSAAATTTVTVNYATANATATAGSDYQSVLGTLSFTPGQTQKTVTVLVNGDTLFEPDEQFVVNLTTASGATIADGSRDGDHPQ